MKNRIKISFLLVLLSLICFTTALYASGGLSLNTDSATAGDTISEKTVTVGEAVTVSGVTDTKNQYIPIKVVDSDNNIILLDVLEADEAGNFSMKFVIPEKAVSPLTVIEGNGKNIAIQRLVVK